MFYFYVLYYEILNDTQIENDTGGLKKYFGTVIQEVSSWYRNKRCLKILSCFVSIELKNDTGCL